MMPSKLRLASILLVATLIVVAGCLMLVSKVNAQGGFKISLVSQHVAGTSSNLGTIVFNGVPYTLPNSVSGTATYPITYNPVPGTYFVRWEFTDLGGGPPTSYIKDPNSATTEVHVDSNLILRAIYGGTAASVGGVLLPTNAFMTLVPYLVAIGLVATAVVAVKKRRN